MKKICNFCGNKNFKETRTQYISHQPVANATLTLGEGDVFVNTY